MTSFHDNLSAWSSVKQLAAGCVQSSDCSADFIYSCIRNLKYNVIYYIYRSSVLIHLYKKTQVNTKNISISINYEAFITKDSWDINPIFF